VPLSEHEQRILDEIERKLIEEDPRLHAKTSLTSHLVRRVRWGLVAFVVGFVLLMLTFAFNLWVAILGFALMFGSALIVYHYLRRMSRDQMSLEGSGKLSITAALARLAERMRRQRGTD
jgi:ABC-type bacteriocin/lantibiotic exporter with double-glycine peptidase domain